MVDAMEGVTATPSTEGRSERTVMTQAWTELRDLVAAAIPRYPSLNLDDEELLLVAGSVVDALQARFGQDHVVLLDEHGWRLQLQHPITCRVEYNLLDCPTNAAVANAAAERMIVHLHDIEAPSGWTATTMRRLLERHGPARYRVADTDDRLELYVEGAIQGRRRRDER